MPPSLEKKTSPPPSRRHSFYESASGVFVYKKMVMPLAASADLDVRAGKILSALAHKELWASRTTSLNLPALEIGNVRVSHFKGGDVETFRCSDDRGR